MKILLTLAINSLLGRKISVILTLICLTLSITLFLSIDNFRGGAKKSFFSNSQAGDLILAAKSGEIQTILYVLFQIGTPSSNIRWDSYQKIKNRNDVEWAIPISLGDSHRQFRVLGTTGEYFKKVKFKNKKFTFFKGKIFENTFDVVIGNDVAKKLNYSLGKKLIISHGISSQSPHTEFPFKVTGILNKTGTPADKLIFVSLEALEAIHKNWKAGIRLPNYKPKNLKKDNLIPKEITAAVIKLKSKIEIFQFQREINGYKNEPLQAIIPGLAISKLWQVISFVENILLIISLMVLITSMIGMSAILYSNIHLRKNEMSLLRIVGASPKIIYILLIFESLIITFLSILFSIIIFQILNLIMNPILDLHYGVFIEYKFLSINNLIFFVFVILLSILISLFPGYKAFKSSIIK